MLGRMLQATHYLHSVGVVSSPLTSWNFDIYVCVGQEVVAVAVAAAEARLNDGSAVASASGSRWYNP